MIDGNAMSPMPAGGKGGGPRHRQLVDCVRWQAVPWLRGNGFSNLSGIACEQVAVACYEGRSQTGVQGRALGTLIPDLLIHSQSPDYTVIAELIDAGPRTARDVAITRLLWEAGLTNAELCALKVADFDSQRGRLIVRTNERSEDLRWISLSSAVSNAIAVCLESSQHGSDDDSPLIRNMVMGRNINNGRMSENGARCSAARLTKEVGSAYALTSCNTLLVEVGRYNPDKWPITQPVLHVGFKGSVCLINPGGADIEQALLARIRHLVQGTDPGGEHRT